VPAFAASRLRCIAATADEGGRSALIHRSSLCFFALIPGGRNSTLPRFVFISMNMKLIGRILISGGLILSGKAVDAQVIDPQRSAQATARNEATYIASSIEDNEAFMFLSQKAKERSSDERVKELAEQMTEAHTSMLYSMGQLATSGTGASEKSGPAPKNQQAVSLNERLANRSGMDFDTMWVSNVLVMMQGKYDELVQQKETVTNPRLKMAVTEAIPLVRKNLSQLKSIQKYLTRLAAQKEKER